MRSQRRSWIGLGLAGALVVPACLLQSAAAQQTGQDAERAGDLVGHPRVMLVVDSSNSMWGQIDGEPKIVIARQAIRALMAAWDRGVPVGLVAYGHRDQDSCRDVGTVTPVGAEPTAIAAAAESLRPLGRSPLTAALRHAAEELGYTDRPATLVLVSDGVESCDLDPCEAAAALEAAGERLTIHAVDLRTPNDRDDSQLQCIVETTGGELVTPATVTDLLPELEVFLGLRIFEAGSGGDDPRFIISPHNGRLIEVYHGEARFAVFEAPVNFLDLQPRNVFFAPRPRQTDAFDPGGIAIRFGPDDNRVLLLWWTRTEDGEVRLDSHQVSGANDLPAQILWMAPRLIRIAFGDAMREPRVIRLETAAGPGRSYQEMLISP